MELINVLRKCEIYREHEMFFNKPVHNRTFYYIYIYICKLILIIYYIKKIFSLSIDVHHP